MKDDWINKPPFAARHPIVFFGVVSVVASIVFLLGGAILAGVTGWDLKEFVIDSSTRMIFNIPSAIVVCFLYRYITTGQFRHVQRPQANVDPR